MSAALKPLPEMDVEAFLAWTLELTGDERYELFDGEPVAMAPQIFRHADAKYRIARACSAAIEAAGLPCRVIVDGMGVPASAKRVFIPDIIVHCGNAIDPEARILDDPLVVMEVISESTKHIDLNVKLVGYFGLPSVRHYVIVDTRERFAVHHARDAAGAIATRIIRAEPVRFDPPGFEIASLFDAT